MTDDFRLYEIDDDFRCVVSQEVWTAPPEELEKQVRQIWEEESLIKGRNLFDGWIFNAQSFNTKEIRGNWIRYRYAIAGYHDPSLGRRLGVKPVAVNGFTVAEKQVLIGHRADTVAAFAGMWELAPSGGVDDQGYDGAEVLSHHEVLLRELTEETGLSLEEVMAAHPFLLVEDRAVNTLELCSQLHVKKDVAQRFIPPCDEYQAFLWLHREQVRDFLVQQSGNIVPLTALILERWVIA